MPKVAQHFALARQWQLLRLLPSRPPGLSSRELAEMLAQEGFRVSKRTVERDLGELSLMFGIACNDKGMPYGWHWMPGHYGDLPGLTVSDALSLRLVENLLRPMLPAATLSVLDQRFAQARNKLADPSARMWVDQIRYVPPMLPLVPPTLVPSVIDTVHAALSAGRQFEVEYRKPSGAAQHYRLHPLALIQRGQIAYLVATAYDYDDPRLYAMHRMQSATLLEGAARVLDGFAIDDYIASGALEFSEGDTLALTAWVSPELGDMLRETPLAPGQVLAACADGYRLTASVRDSWQLTWWVLSQAANIRIEAPASFRQRIREHIAAMASAYADAP